AAAEVLSHDPRPKLPAEYGPVFARAIAKYRDGPKNGPGVDALRTLVWLGTRVGTDDVLDATLPMARDDWWASTAGRALAFYPQPRATAAARGLLKHGSEDVRFEVARALANRHDPAALDVLLDVASRPGKWRAYACSELVKYPTDKRVEPALK